MCHHSEQLYREPVCEMRPPKLLFRHDRNRDKVLSPTLNCPRVVDVFLSRG